MVESAHEQASAEAWHRASQWEAILRPLLGQTCLSKAAVEDARQQMGVGRAYFYRLLAAYKQRPQTSTLIPPGNNAADDSYYENEDGLPTVALLGSLTRVLGVTSDELLGLKPMRVQESPQKRRLWKRLQRIESLPERDQRAVLRLINSLVASNGNGQPRGSAHP